MAVDHQQEYWDRVNAWREKKRAERKAQENNSNFTILSLVGFALGAGIFYQTSHLIVGTIALTALGAVIGAIVDYCLVYKHKNISSPSQPINTTHVATQQSNQKINGILSRNKK